MSVPCSRQIKRVGALFAGGTYLCRKVSVAAGLGSKDVAHIAQLVEHVLGKDEVSSSNLDMSSTFFPGGRLRVRS